MASDIVALLLGPEGGWVPEERTKAVTAGWTPVSLGNTVLRAETAGVAGLAVLKALWARDERRVSNPPQDSIP